MKILLWLLFLLPFSLQALVLQEEVRRDLELAGIPLPPQDAVTDGILDVAIIGGGQAGMSLSLGLQKEGIFNVAIFDGEVEGCEGPWSTCARMHTLRSIKEIPGPALGLPHLTFRAWYEATHNDWDSLHKIPTPLWADYLKWYREVLGIKVQNGYRLSLIIPQENHFKLLFNGDRTVLARKVVLATGRSGFGGFETPEFAKNFPKSLWYHTGERIDPSLFTAKKVCVVGSGASAFDVSGAALEAGAERVDMLTRKEDIHKVPAFVASPCWPAYFFCNNEERIHLFQKVLGIATPPPGEAIARVEKWPNFYLHSNTYVSELFYTGKIVLMTNQGPLQTDLLVLATGYAVDVTRVAELSLFAHKILLWGGVVDELPAKISRFPYLGKNFEFLEKIPGACPFLKNIHCFNYGAFLSHGCISGDIEELPIGVKRLAEGIAIDLFLDHHLPKIE